jgi:hypothetical protein
MPTEHNRNTTIASAAYAVLRQGGAPPAHACAQLSLGPCEALELERLFSRRRGSAHGMRPSFAHHDRHLHAVLAQGGFPALPGRRR